MADLPLHKVTETTSTITLGWTPPPGAVGYRFSREKAGGKYSHTWDGNRDQAKFSKDSSWYAVEALGQDAIGKYPAPPVPEPPTGEPAPIAGQGYKRVFRDDFDVFDGGPGKRWSRKLWWNPLPPAGTEYAQDSILHLVSKRKDGYPWINVCTLDEVDFNSPRGTFLYGYFEARIKCPKGNGSFPAFWLLQADRARGQAGPNRLTCEIDIVEFQGSDARDPSSGQPVIRGGNFTIHRNTNSDFGVPDQYKPDPAWIGDLGVDTTTDFHVYSATWTPQEVILYVDGKERKRTSVWDSTPQYQFVILSMQIGSWFGRPIDASTPDELHFEVDYIDVWQKP